MRLVLLTETFAKNMGYLGSVLPRHLARLGVDVHVVTMDLPPYHQIADFEKTYGGFSAGAVPAAGTVEEFDGYHLHVLPHKSLLGYMRMRGLFKKLRELKPDVVQALPHIGWIPLDAAIAGRALRFPLFTGAHTTASVFPLAQRTAREWDWSYFRSVLTRALPGRMVSLRTEKCYAATTDCADVAVRFFGVQKSKIEVCPLGVDTELFFPPTSEASQTERKALRAQLGFTEGEIVCIYTGRFSEDKNPLLLAQAIDRLTASGLPFRGLFLGGGVQQEAIAGCRGCILRPFVPFSDLRRWFHATDIGVWPTQESTSMLDAAACGLPIIVNDLLIAVERISGNGLTYRLNDLNDLARVIASLRSAARRAELGTIGAQRMKSEFSWASIASRRLRDYEAASAQRDR
jgi:glycosyltransferase involved in cell wall biosynthesis